MPVPVGSADSRTMVRRFVTAVVYWAVGIAWWWISGPIFASESEKTVDHVALTGKPSVDLVIYALALTLPWIGLAAGLAVAFEWPRRVQKVLLWAIVPYVLIILVSGALLYSSN